MLNFTRIGSLERVIHAKLRERAERAQSGRSQEFVADIAGHEVGFISYEDWSDRSLGFIYEIFVLPEYRGQGIGSGLLLHAEALAQSLLCAHIQLDPNVFDRTLKLEWLVSWYVRKGYRPIASGSTRMEKILVAAQT